MWLKICIDMHQVSITINHSFTDSRDKSERLNMSMNV